MFSLTSGYRRSRFNFKPTDIANCTFWIDGADLSTMWQDVDKTVAVENTDDPVASITDKIGELDYQNDAGNTTYVNGLQFNGTGLDHGTGYNINGNKTIFVVYTKPAVNNNEEYLWSTSGGAAAPAIIQNYVADTDEYFEPGSGPRFTIFDDTITGINLVSFRRSGAVDLTISLFANGTEVAASPAAVNDTNVGTANITIIGLGTLSTIHEMIIYNSLLTSQQIKIVEYYLAKKWDILSKLPASDYFPI